MNKLLALIAVCIAAAECSTIFQPDVHLITDCARQKTKQCVVPNLEQYDEDFETYAAVADFASNRTNVDDLAESFDAAQTCIENENKEEVCSGDNEDDVVDNNVNFVADFLKSSHHRALAVNASQSFCLSYDYLIRYVEEDFDNYCVSGLYDALMDENTDLCQAVDTMRRCLLDITAYYCGQAAAAFVDYAWYYGVHTPYGRQWIENSRLPAFVVNGCYE